MIVVKLMGGLGNQMFQYAAGRSLSIKRGTKLFMDLSWFDNVANVDTPRVYELDCFRVNQNFIDSNRYTLIDKYEPNVKTRVYKITKGLRRPYITQLVENGHQFNKSFNESNDNTYLNGFWQSEKYFDTIRPVLLKDFEYKAKPSAKNLTLIKEISGCYSVSLHVRRGDYASNKATNAFHGLTGINYYQAAIKKMAARIKQPVFYVFSDDPEWCKRNLKVNFPTVYVDHNENGSDDLRLMRYCKHNIIANSSFSWWGAWLNPNTDKIVVAPKKWFNDSSIDTSDVIPKEWIKL